MPGILLLALMTAISLTGCFGAIKAYPDRAINVKDELEQLKPYLEANIKSTYEEETDPAKKQVFRNRIVDSRLQAIDLHFYGFEQELYRQGVVTNIGFDFIILGLTGAIATVGGEGLKEALGATSAGLIGAKTSIDKNAFFEKSIPALLAQMSASRATVLVQIRDGLTKSVEEYPLDQALTDLENYHNAGTLPGALQAITTQAGAAKQEADKILFGMRTKEFFKKERQERVEGLIAKINSLGDRAAISLAKDPLFPWVVR